MEDEILERIKDAAVDCPECEHMEDDQYTCTTCWGQGGGGKLNVFDYLNEHQHLLDT